MTKAKSSKVRLNGNLFFVDKKYELGYRNGYEQDKSDAEGIKATALIERDRAARKQTLKEVLKRYQLYDGLPNEDYLDYLKRIRKTFKKHSKETFREWLEQ